MAQLLALAVGLGIVLWREALRLQAVNASGSAWTWFWDVDIDTTPILCVFLCLPVFWLWPHAPRRRKPPAAVDAGPPPASPRWFMSLLSTGVAILSLGTSLWIASRPTGPTGIPFADLPPAYHDEYSYLFQAHTFLTGQVAVPSHPDVPELFDQMHVLNEGRMASRYFPGTGVWMMPFVAWGHPHWGHWLAGALACVLVLWTGTELANWRVGLLAGTLTAVSPGVALFGNLLLAHHPTLLAITVFVWAMTVLGRRPGPLIALLAGSALGFAMLSRPMTAAAIGFPYGVWLFHWAVFKRDSECFAKKTQDRQADEFLPARRRRVGLMLLVGLPVLIGGGLLMAYDAAITGDPLQTPYQLYTDTYTPRHVYGFHNVQRGEQRLGPKVIEDYDRWAEDLTWPLALRNVRNRIVASWQWTLGLVPLAMAAVVFCLTTPRTDRGWWLVAAAIASLHLAHVPYWYDGIMHWHYVFESAPLWCLLLARAGQRVTTDWTRWSRPALKFWLALLLLTALLPQYLAAPPFWQQSRLDSEMQNLAFSRLRYADFDRAIAPLVAAARRTGQPILILIQGRHDVHIDYVTNFPPLDRLILRGRFDPAITAMPEILQAFPERDVYLFNVDAWSIGKVDRRNADLPGVGIR